MKDDDINMDMLHLNDLQLLALSVHRQLILFKNAASMFGSSVLHREIERNVKTCAHILGTRILSAQDRSSLDRKKLQQRVKDFQDLMIPSDPNTGGS